MAALNIKNAETHALARELAERTGESLTDAVTTAVRERLERLGSAPDDIEARLAAVRAISEDMARRWGPYDPTEDPTAFLYDEQTGLPR